MRTSLSITILITFSYAHLTVYHHPKHIFLCSPHWQSLPSRTSITFSHSIARLLHFPLVLHRLGLDPLWLPFCVHLFQRELLAPTCVNIHTRRCEKCICVFGDVVCDRTLHTFTTHGEVEKRPWPGKDDSMWCLKWMFLFPEWSNTPSSRRLHMTSKQKSSEGEVWQNKDHKQT